MSRTQVLKTRREHHIMGMRELAKNKQNPLTLDWIFSQWYEKLILVILTFLGLYGVINILIMILK